MKKAFTLLELLFVIIIIGILSAAIIPRSKSDSLREAAIQVVSHIRYTQHLAMVDDKYDTSDSKWYQGRWQIVFANDSNYTDHQPAYTIFSDKPSTSGNYGGDAVEAEIAKNPENPEQIMTGGYGSSSATNYTKDGFKGMKKLNLGHSYGITSITLSNECDGRNNNSMRISFDYLGRPFQGNANSLSGPYTSASDTLTENRLIKKNCAITLSDSEGNVTIIITPETGYTYIN